MERQDIFQYVKKVYGTVPEYLWEHHPAYAALRMSTSKECYAVLKREDYGENEILEVQYDPAVMGSLVKIQGLLPDRNAEDGNWVYIPLDGSVSEATVLDFLDRSYELVEERLH